MNSSRPGGAGGIAEPARRALIGAGGAVLAWLVLLAALNLGLITPREERLDAFARLAGLDYLFGQAGAFGSLTEEFIADALGLELADSMPTVPDPVRAAEDIVDATPATAAAFTGPGRPARTIAGDPELDNDDFDEAYPVRTLPFTGESTREAGRENADPVTCEPLGDTFWFRYRPDRNIGLLSNTFGSDHHAALAVFTQDAQGALVQIECDVNSAGNAQVVFPGQEGRTYYFQVTRQADTGRAVFNLDPLGRTTRASVSSTGRDGDAESAHGSISADGRFVAFHTWAALGSRDDNGLPDIYVRDTWTERTELVSVTSRGAVAEGREFTGSTFPAISGNGRYVAFFSSAHNLVEDDGNHAVDLFVHDRETGATDRLSVSSKGEEGQRPPATRSSCHPVRHPQEPERPLFGCWFNDHGSFLGVSISANGRYVLFASDLEGLVPDAPRCTAPGSANPGDQQESLPGMVVPGVDAGWLGCRHIYLHDRRTDRTMLVSRSSEGEPAMGDSSSPFISPNGRWIVFASDAANLVTGDDNGFRDVFVRERVTGRTELVSLSSAGEQGDQQSGGLGVRGHATISNDGRWVAFISNASNLAPGDENLNTDVFLRDLTRGRTSLISHAPGDSAEARASRTSGGAHSYITADGRYVAFTSMDPEPRSDEVPIREILVYDRVTRTTTVVSLRTSGMQDDGVLNLEPEISPDGHFVVFQSDASNLGGRDTDSGPGFGSVDLFIHELPWTR